MGAKARAALGERHLPVALPHPPGRPPAVSGDPPARRAATAGRLSSRPQPRFSLRGLIARWRGEHVPRVGLPRGRRLCPSVSVIRRPRRLDAGTQEKANVKRNAAEESGLSSHATAAGSQPRPGSATLRAPRGTHANGESPAGTPGGVAAVGRLPSPQHPGPFTTRSVRCGRARGRRLGPARCARTRVAAPGSERDK